MKLGYFKVSDINEPQGKITSIFPGDPLTELVGSFAFILLKMKNIHYLCLAPFMKEKDKDEPQSNHPGIALFFGNHVKMALKKQNPDEKLDANYNIICGGEIYFDDHQTLKLWNLKSTGFSMKTGFNDADIQKNRSIPESIGLPVELFEYASEMDSEKLTSQACDSKDLNKSALCLEDIQTKESEQISFTQRSDWEASEKSLWTDRTSFEAESAKSLLTESHKGLFQNTLLPGDEKILDKLNEESACSNESQPSFSSSMRIFVKKNIFIPALTITKPKDKKPGSQYPQNT